MAQGTAINSSVPDDLELPPEELPRDDLPLDPNDADAGEAAIEARAREMGWKPLIEYRGPPRKWQPAADFIARGENILPILRDNFRRLSERTGKLESEITNLRSTNDEQLKIIKDLRDMGQRANQAGYDRAMAEIKAKQRAAVEQGDTKAYDQLVEQAEALQDSRMQSTTTTAPAVPVKPVQLPEPPPMTEPTKAFVAANDWFRTNKLLSDTMIGFHLEVLNERQATQAMLNADPELDRELLEEAKSRVIEKYPERFGVQRRVSAPEPHSAARPRRAAVAQPTPEPPAPRSGAAASINAIADPAERAEAREAFNRMKRQLPDYTEAEYMALYADPHGDILVMQQKPRSQANGR